MKFRKVARIPTPMFARELSIDIDDVQSDYIGGKDFIENLSFLSEKYFGNFLSRFLVYKVE